MSNLRFLPLLLVVSGCVSTTVQTSVAPPDHPTFHRPLVLNLQRGIRAHFVKAVSHAFRTVLAERKYHHQVVSVMDAGVSGEPKPDFDVILRVSPEEGRSMNNGASLEMIRYQVDMIPKGKERPVWRAQVVSKAGLYGYGHAGRMHDIAVQIIDRLERDRFLAK